MTKDWEQMFRISLNMKPVFVRPEILFEPDPIPVPLHGVNPRSIEGQEWWDEVRSKAYRNNNDCCWACGIHRSKAEFHQWLEAHEIYEVDYKKAQMTLKSVAALCHSCHNFIHLGRLKELLRAGKVDHKKYSAIFVHGNVVIRKYHLQKKHAKLRRRHRRNHKKSSLRHRWGDWHLLWKGKKHHSHHKGPNEWAEYYQSQNQGSDE